MGKTSFMRIARALVVIWPLIWTANVFANDCQKLAVEGDHRSVGRDNVSEKHVHANGHSHSQDHDQEEPSSDRKGTGSCCCDKLTATAVAISHDVSVPSGSRNHAQPDLTLQTGVSTPLPFVKLAHAYGQPPPQSRTPLFLLHLRLLN